MIHTVGRVFGNPTEDTLEDGLLRPDNDIVHDEELFHLVGGQLEELVGLADILEAFQQVVVGPGFHLTDRENVAQ